MGQLRRTWVEINRSAFEHNIRQIRVIAPTTIIGIVIKANAYGHGLIEIAQLAEEHSDISWIFVAGTAEALSLRAAGIKKPILALAYVDTDLEDVILKNISVTLYCQEQLGTFFEAAQLLKKTVNIHIKVDTGMVRLGVPKENFLYFLENNLLRAPVNIEGLFTHLCDTLNEDLSFTNAQLSHFKMMSMILRKRAPFLAHVIASGSLFMPDKFDMVRIGTMLYGFWKSSLHKQRIKRLYPFITLKKIGTWKTYIIDMKNITAGTSVGYNCSFVAPYPMIIGIVPVGYSDGYPRNGSKTRYVKVKNCFAPVVGIISMNMMHIDLTHIPQVSRGDIVTLLADDHLINAETIADACDTIPNEIIGRIDKMIPRIIVVDENGGV